MTTTFAEPVAAPSARSELLKILALPLVFVLTGLVIRYGAYVAGKPGASFIDFAQGLCRWDCHWYVTLAERGYDRFPVPNLITAGNWAFFPLYPIFVGAILKLVQQPTMVVATITSIVLSWAAVVAAWPLFERNWRAYTLYAAFILSGPFSIYFTTFYTEVMFILTMTCVFVALKRGNYLAAGLFGALLSATRIVGVFIVFAILIQAYVDHRAKGGTFRTFVTGIWLRTDLLLALVIAPLGCFLYMAFLHYQIGDALAFQHDQRAWGRVTGNPLGYIWRGLTNFPGSGWVPTSSQELAVAVTFGLAMSVVLVVRRQFAAGVFCFICLALPLFTGLASVLRFVVGLVPISVQIMKALAFNRATTAVALLLFLVLDYFFTQGWTGGALALV